MIFQIEGCVTKGKRVGRTLGFPTLNINIEQSEEVLNGVYLSRVSVGDQSYDAISNVGYSPTVGGVERRVESFLLSYKGDDLYDRHIVVTLLERVRDEREFGSLDELKEQIARDVQAAKLKFNIK